MTRKERRSYKDKAYWGNASVELLKKMIAIPSLSRQEDAVATLIQNELEAYGIPVLRIGHNVIAMSAHFKADKPSIILNSHHDTVPPNPHYTQNPFDPKVENGQLFGLGSNDAGGCLSSLIHGFVALYEEELYYNLILIASAEEEISGKNGIELVFKNASFRDIYPGHMADFAIVGEPTLMHMAVAERGLMVIDAVTRGVAGHAARHEGESALYKATDDIMKIQNFRFEKNSDLLGPVKTTVTVIHTENKIHNVVPDTCHYVMDCRINEKYSFEEVLSILQAMLQAELTPRSMRLRSSMIPLDHPVVKAGLTLGKEYYGSPTTSDKALLPIPALKIGPGDSARSHTADEFIFIHEIHQGLSDYIDMILLVQKINPSR